MKTKPTILISKCLGFEACRYNGQIIQDKIVKLLKEYVNFIPVCPEVEIGLPIPRNQLSIVNDELIEHKTNRKLTKEMEDFSEDFISKLEDLDGAIFMSRSPSCSLYSAKLYNNDSKIHVNGAGLFTRKIRESFPNILIEERGRINNYNIRENFLIKIFLLKNFKERKSTEEFHKKNKFLLMSLDEELMKEMGKLVSERNEEEYKKKLYEILTKEQTMKQMTNTLTYIYEFFKDKISKKEKDLFSKLIQEYSEERAPKPEVLILLKDWAIRFDEKYILEQTIFNPYPKELEIITDSGSGRDL